MKTLAHIELKNNDQVMVDFATKKELNTANLITIALGQSKYTSTAEQWQAYEITKKIAEGKDVELEEADYELVKKKVEAFEPYRTGFVFIPFLELFK
jgi:sulfur relay (sulfurtransferase) DsrC/TusE family protein